jgi:hypothetical protein
MSWSANPAANGVAHYNVYRTDQTFTGPWAMPTATTFTNTSSLVNGTQYCYQVSASNATGESAKSAAVCLTPTAPVPVPTPPPIATPPPTTTPPVPAATVPSVPSGLKAVASGTKVVLTWKANPAGNGVSHYNVYRTDQTFTGAWAQPTATTFTNTGGVVSGKRYCYKLSATNKYGDSAKSAAVCVTVSSATATAARVKARKHHQSHRTHRKTKKRPSRRAVTSKHHRR